jgi:hypothetical protein
VTRAVPLFHPRERTLSRFADGMLPREERTRVNEHLAACARCRSHVAFARDVGGAARRLAGPEPDGALLARVLAERAAGARTILPLRTTPPAARRRAIPYGLKTAAAVLAAGAALTVAARTVGRVVHEPIGGQARNARLAARAQFGDVPGFFTGVTAHVQDWAALPLPRPARLLPERMRPVRATYEIHQPDRGGVLRPVGRNVVDVVPVALDGVEAWRVTRVQQLAISDRRRERVETETVYVARADLRLLGRTERVAPYEKYAYITIRQRVAEDHVEGWMNVDEGLGRPIHRELPPEARPYTTDALAPVLLMAAPLHARWSGSVSMLRWAVGDVDVYSRVSLRVTGEERVTVPAGTFECWQLTVVTDGRPLEYWVRKSDGLGVKVRTPGRELLLAAASD